MLFSKIKGHGNTLSYLENMCESRVTLAGNYLFKGPESVGKFASAKLLAKYLTCLSTEIDTECRCGNCRIFPGSPDYIEINKGSEIIKIEDVEPFEQWSALHPFKSKKKVIIINNADNLNLSASNRLLKLLEEDRGYLVCILITSKINLMLPALVSRCRVIAFENLRPEIINDILSNVSINAVDQEFLRKIQRYMSGGILSNYSKYLSVSKKVPSFVRLMTGKDEGSILTFIDTITTNGELVNFVELLVVYLNDILKMHFSATKEVSFLGELDNLEFATSLWSEEICFTLIAKLRACLEIYGKGLNLDIKQNVKSSLSGVYMLLNRKKTV